MLRLKPETFVIPKELSVEFQTLIQRFHDESTLDTIVKDWYENLAFIYHQHKPDEHLSETEFDRVVILMTTDESEAFEAAYETACEKFDDIAEVEKKYIYTALAMHTLENYETQLIES